MPKQFKPQVTIQEEMNINKRTISEITKIMWNSDSEETIFTCQRKIINIDIDNSGWYRIQLKVEDSSGIATFILFDSEAEKLLNISTKDLLNKCLKEPEEVILPVQIENLKGKQFVFQIQLNDYNLKYGWELCTVVKLFDYFEKTGKAIQLDKMTEAYIMILQMNVPNWSNSKTIW
ncbi:hypothetical protein CFP56_034532 [Quercus suber]|uniref:Replication protein A1 n=1 Tax=Quercus suber TaxID=58331 RepID=A0AAW0JBU4_QUESU